MTLTEANEAILQHFVSNYISTPFTFEGEQFVQPADGTSYIRVQVLPTNNLQETLGREGGRRFERSGLISVTVRTAVNVGTAPAFTLYEALKALLESQRIGSLITTLTSQARAIGTDRGRFGLLVTVPFRFSETR